MSKLLKLLIAVNLMALTVMVFVYPNLMVGPGKLIPGHKQLESDCFACHTAFLGADSGRCLTCHKPEEIGRQTTTGLPIAKPLTAVAFHQKLIARDCVACHSDHAGVRRLRMQGHFKHALLQPAMREECQSCHQTPNDALHRQITGNCSECHSQEHWTPATFDHEQHFKLDRDHNTRCVTCHTGNDYSRYTCYGCHEHTLANIRREHIEEGIRKFDNCAECHRSANKDDIRGGKSRENHGKKKQDD